MEDKNLHILEYDKIINRLAGFSASEAGRNMCLALRPMKSIGEIKAAQAQTSDAKARINRHAGISFGGIRDVLPAIKRLGIASSLSTAELLGISNLLEVTKRVKSYGDNDADVKDSLTGYFAGLDPLRPLATEISRCILSEEEIADDASPSLRTIRRTISNTNDKIRVHLNQLLITSKTYLQDSVVTMRDGRYCLPVRAEYKGQVPGLIHDQSGSGSTFFIEPMSIVKLNNELRELEGEEKKEIEKILALLSAKAYEHVYELEADYKLLTELDFIFAKAEFSISYKGIEPEFNDELAINIIRGRHPLLDPEKVVPSNVRLGEDFDQLLITGPNTGGKTVTLKTIGLLTLMGEAGLHIPADEGSKLSVFGKVFADIGDEQSIEQSLSTFSAHMTNITKILAEADERSLVLFDELGAGTDPTEGAALAMAILSRLHRQGTRTAATTHYSELKLYALSTKGIENASCEFDVSTLRPTYRLLIGVPGKSNAFNISARLGLDKEVIDEAKSLIGKQDETFEDVISDLEGRRKNMEESEAAAKRLQDEAFSIRAELAGKQDRLEMQRQKILADAKEEAREILQKAKDFADKSIRYMHKHGIEVSRELEADRTALRAEIDAITPEKKETKEKPSGLSAKDIRIGTGIHVISLDTNGTVSTMPDDKGNLYVQLGILRTQVNISDLELNKEDEANASSKTYGGGKIKFDKALNISTEINLIGMRVDEATSALDKYLDDAYLARLSQVRIIHGRGTGALKNAVNSMLKKNPNIKSFRRGEVGEGGDGATVAEFK